MSTPRTDELYNSVCFFTDEEQAVDALANLRDLARQLERENIALNETTKKHVAAYYEMLAENTALRNQLKEAQP